MDVNQLSSALTWLYYPVGYPDIQAAINPDTGEWFIETWDLDTPKPTNEELLAEAANPESVIYQNIKAHSAAQVDRIVEEWRVKLVGIPEWEQARWWEYQRKREVADYWFSLPEADQLPTDSGLALTII